MKTLTLTANGVTANLTVRNATIGDDMRRSMLAAHALQNPLPDPAEQTVAVVIFPRCLACADGELIFDLAIDDLRLENPQSPIQNPKSKIVNPKSLTPAEFVALPAAIGAAWLNAALEENPAWSLAPLTDDEQESAEKKG